MTEYRVPQPAVDAARDVLPMELRIYVGRVEMRAALEAAAPHMLAAEYDRGFNAGFDEGFDEGHRAGQESMDFT